LRLTAAAQVYGGSVAFIVHPYVWSSNSFDGVSSSSAGSTIVAGFAAVFLDCNFSGSVVSTRSISDPTLLFFPFHFTVLALVLRSHSHGCL
jgi:hypothetical protein